MKRFLALVAVSVAALAGAKASWAQLAPTGSAGTTASAPALAAAAVGEQPLDTDVRPAAPALPVPVRQPEAPPNRKVRTVSDEHLPKWVPIRGRLTVVESSDLAENLGLVPKGASKKSETPISVAEKLAEESAARAARTDPMTQGSSWSYAKPGKFRNHR